MFCGITNERKYNHWKDLVDAVAQELHGAAAQDKTPSAGTYREAETVALRKIQLESFPEDFQLLKSKQASSLQQLV